MDLSLWSRYRQGLASRAGLGSPDPTCRLSGSRRRSGCVPAEPYPPLERGELGDAVRAREGEKGNDEEMENRWCHFNLRQRISFG
jgi:hypothetical protein